MQYKFKYSIYSIEVNTIMSGRPRKCDECGKSFERFRYSNGYSKNCKNCLKKITDNRTKLIKLSKRRKYSRIRWKLYKIIKD